jgi:TonB family protein
MRWSERSPAVRSRFPWLGRLHFEPRTLPVAVAHLVLVRPMKRFVAFLSLLVLSAFASQAAERHPKRTAIYAARPEYPIEARRLRLTGAGVFAMHVRPDGTVSSVEVLKSTGHAILDQAAIAAFRQWRFHAGTVTKVTTPIRFTANGAR